MCIIRCIDIDIEMCLRAPRQKGNIMMRNPPSAAAATSSAKVHGTTKATADCWTPRLVLIDFGLAGTAGNKGVSHEERAEIQILSEPLEKKAQGFRRSLIFRP